jgi:methionyl-tRNA formyltransferase
MNKFIIISKKVWDQKNYIKFNKKKFFFFKKINENKIFKINPKIIFFIHWSKIIKPKIYKKYICIQFHSSNLPKFKGGSPIQNQIIRGVQKTKITSFRINSKIDGGDICLKKNISLKGRAEEIYKRIENISLKMIIQITSMKKIKFFKQKGSSSNYKRRMEKQSNIGYYKLKSLKKYYDFIRMLDASGYPNAFCIFGKYKFYFKNAKLKKKSVVGNFEIKKK